MCLSLKQQTKEFILIGLIITSFIIGVLIYPNAPDTLPTHWNSSGEADSFGPKWLALFMLPIVTAFTYLLFFIIPKIAVFKKNFAKFEKEFFYLKATIISFLTLIYLGTTAQIFYKFNLNILIIPAISAMFFIIGHLMPKFKRNFFVGIRTPWTLANDKVWEKTHKLGGTLFKICAVILLIGIFIPKYLVYIILPTIIILITILFVYSYLEFKKEQTINSFKE